MKIDGHTLIYALIGYPISHTYSPAMLNAAFGSIGENAVYVPFAVPPGSLRAAVQGLCALGVKGFNVTVPHKSAVMEYLDSVSDEAAIIGAVNTVVVEGDKLRGKNTDGRGFVKALELDCGFSLHEKTVFIMGAGGAGRAIGVMSALQGAGEVRIADLDNERAVDLVDTINTKVKSGVARTIGLQSPQLEGALTDVNLFVDATPLGLQRDDGASIDVTWLNGGAVIYDLVYNPPVTKLIADARAAGKKAENGMGMLLHQGAISFELWTGEEAPLEVMRVAIEEAMRQL